MIKMATFHGPDDGGVETFADLDALAADFKETADPEYAEKVLSALQEGESVVEIENSGGVDVYWVVNE